MFFLKLSVPSTLLLYALVVLCVLVVRSVLGFAPQAPTVSILDISDSRPNLTLDDTSQ